MVSDSVEVLGYIRYSDLFPKITPNIGDLLERLVDLDFDETAAVLSKFNLLLSERQESHDPKLQIILSKHFLNEYTLDRVKKTFDAHSVLFHRHQTLFLQKTCFLNPSKHPDRAYKYSTYRYKLGTALLITNDLLSILNLNASDLDEKPIDSQKELIWKESLAGWELSNPSELMLDISRMRIIFNRILPACKGKAAYFDLDETFRSSVQLPIPDFMFFVMSLLTLYLKKRENVLDDPSSIYLFKDQVLKNVRSDFPKASFDIFLDNISCPLKNYRDLIASSKDREFNYGFLPFRKKPLAKINDNVYFCLDFHFLLEKISTGIFWAINDCLEGERRNNFHSFWGSLFEEYISTLIVENLKSGDAEFFVKPCYDGTQEEVADGILVYGEEAVLLEYKFTFLSQEAKYENTTDSLNKEIKQKFEKNTDDKWKGYGQLAANINKLFSKTPITACKQIAVGKVRRIYPVLVVYYHILESPFTNYIFNRNFQELLSKSSLTQGIEIAPLLLITIEDFEKSLPFLNRYPDLLRERIAYDRSLNFGFSAFLRPKLAGEGAPKPENLTSEYRRFFKEVLEYFFARS